MGYYCAHHFLSLIYTSFDGSIRTTVIFVFGDSGLRYEHFTNYCSAPVLVQKMLTWFSFRHSLVQHPPLQGRLAPEAGWTRNILAEKEKIRSLS